MDIFQLFISAIFVNNIVLAQYLGNCPYLGCSKEKGVALGMGGAVIFVIIVATACTWLMQRYVLEPFGLGYLQTIVFIVVIASLVQFVEMFLKKMVPPLYAALGIFLPLITTNCAVMGVAILVQREEYDLLTSVLYGAASAVGFTLALVDTDAVYAGRDGMRLGRQGMGLTLDGIAKGHIVDAMSAVLLRAGCENHLINAGGDILARGHKSQGVSWRVAVEDPEKRGHYPQVLELYNQAIATSGGYEVTYDAGGRHHHLLDPSTGRSPVLGSMSVLAATCMQADALATGLSVLPAGEALALADSLSGCACGLLRRDGRLQVSRRWPAEA